MESDGKSQRFGQDKQPAYMAAEDRLTEKAETDGGEGVKAKHGRPSGK